MADVRPFRGLRYDTSVVKDMARVMSEPYDVISPEQQKQLHDLSPYNVIRLELGMEKPGDGPAENRYTRAAATLSDWIKQGVLKQDETPCFYLARHTFQIDGRLYSRISLYAAARLMEWEEGVIKPHEYTHANPKKDRMELLKACRTNISPVMGMYNDPTGKIKETLEAEVKRKPEYEATLANGQGHALWRISGATAVSAIREGLHEQPIYIADGHHRYETALAYRNALLPDAKARVGDEAVNFVMIALIDFRDTGLVAQPYHRVVRGLSKADVARLETRLDGLFECRAEKSASRQLERQAEGIINRLGPSSFCIYAGGEFRSFVVKDEAGLDRLMPKDKSKEWNRLPVSIIHGALLNPVMGDQDQAEREGRIAYPRSTSEAVMLIERGDFQMLFLVPPLALERLRKVADNGERMPQKSTFFYPKLPTGLVMNRLEGKIN